MKRGQRRQQRRWQEYIKCIVKKSRCINTRRIRRIWRQKSKRKWNSFLSKQLDTLRKTTRQSTKIFLSLSLNTKIQQTSLKDQIVNIKQQSENQMKYKLNKRSNNSSKLKRMNKNLFLGEIRVTHLLKPLIRVVTQINSQK